MSLLEVVRTAPLGDHDHTHTHHMQRDPGFPAVSHLGCEGNATLPASPRLARSVSSSLMYSKNPSPTANGNFYPKGPPCGIDLSFFYF